MPGAVTKRARREYLVYLARRPEVRKLMAEPNIRPKELAQELGLQRNTVYGVLQGRESSKRVAEKICAYFGRPLEDLFFVLDLEDLPPAETGNVPQASAASV
ncbi:MAG: helix-turn-helix transcriptional regulator [Thermodesulfobacteriota bacterium]